MDDMTQKNQTGVNELDRMKTITMLYEGALNFVRVARKKMQQGDSYGKEMYIGKTSAIVSELSRSLNLEGGEVAQNLKKLYDYIFACLQQARTDDNLKAFEDVEKVIEILRDAWGEMIQVAQSP